MDLFVLDSLFRRTAVFDLYESLIWTERFAAHGDFQLVIPSTLRARTLLTAGTRLAINESTRVMTVENVLDKQDDQGRVYLNVSGPSLEEVLNDRVARTLVPNSDVKDINWYFTDKLPAAIIREIFQYVAIDGSIDIGDKLPFYTPGNIYPADTIPEPDIPVTLNIPPMTLYSAIKQLCEIYDLGFRLVRNRDTSQLMFNVYSGTDRTTLQTTLPAVIFAPELDNLKNVAYLTSVSAYKNLANVISPDGSAMVYAEGVPNTISGFERKVLHVDANDIRYADRAEMEILPYVVSEAQEAAITIVKNISTTTELQGNSLSKIPQMDRLYAQDLVNINTAIATVYTVSPAQLTSINTAKALVSATQDQKDALNRLSLLTRLTNSDITSINQFLSNNTVVIAGDKTNIIDAANAQMLHPSQTEKDDILAAIAVSQTYEASEDAVLQALLIQRGKEELANNTNLAAFDGEISKNSQYIYGRDYQLGDLVEIRNSDKVSQQMRVVEQIFASDAEGDRAYPTLAVKLLITSGSWYAWPSAEVWDDLTTETWNTV